MNTSSAVHNQGRIDPADLNQASLGYRALFRYGTSKQANVLFASEAARRWPDIESTSYHPGVVRTRFGSGNPLFRFYYKVAPGLRTPAKGAETLVWLATAPRDSVVNGGYYNNCRLAKANPRGTDPVAAAALWEASLAAVGAKG